MSKQSRNPEDYFQVHDLPSYPNGAATMARIFDKETYETHTVRIHDESKFLVTFDGKPVPKDGYEIGEVINADE